MVKGHGQGQISGAQQLILGALLCQESLSVQGVCVSNNRADVVDRLLIP